VTFSGAFAARRGQRVLYITERAVFDLVDGRIRLVEVAPGIDVGRDVLGHMEFRPLVADPLPTMDDTLFGG
jgi:propionate CoA-transferase